MKTRLIHVKVTEEDIKEGARHNATYCPIYLAVHRACPRLRFAVNCLQMLRGKSDWIYKDDPRDVEWPPQTQMFISKFDFGDEVSPFEFDMEIKV